MWSEEQIDDYLRVNLNKSRYEHSLGVRDASIRLAQRYSEDIFKAKIAGLVHDCAKNMSDDELINIVSSKGYEIDSVSLKCPQLLHGIAASIIAEERMEIYDKDILSAVAYHTTGRINMSKLEKIIYIADYIEPSRSFPGVEELRIAVFDDLDKALVKAFDSTIRYVLERHQLLHINTIQARNYLLY